MKTENQLKGCKGEEIAAQYLASKGYRIKFKNWRKGNYEVDLIVENQLFTVFVEVKFRTKDRYGPPEAFVTQQKRQTLLKAANIYQSINSVDNMLRFDIVSVLESEKGVEVVHFEDAFH